MKMAGSTAARVGGAAIAMVVVAELAVWLLSPRDEPPQPLPVAEQDYFSRRSAAAGARLPRRPALADGRRARRSRSRCWSRWRSGVRRACAGGLERLATRPVAGAAVAGAGVALLTNVATLPTRLIAHERAVDAGLSTQELGPWLWDVARSAGDHPRR